ncbi:MAG: NAD(P)H-binding protein [Lysobacter sp.]|nr:NAD(P)H-binding protein [Lysobacter sp.]
MNHRHVVILGGTGFVGRHLVARLLDAGHRVSVLSRSQDSDKRMALPEQATIRQGDVHDPAFLRDAFSDADAVINLVGILNEKGDDGAGFERVFVELTRTIIAAMQAAGVKRLLQSGDNGLPQLGIAPTPVTPKLPQILGLTARA